MSKFWWTVYGAVVVVALLVTVMPRAIGADFNFSLNASDNASAQDVGLPFYPGAKVHKKDKDDDSSAKVSGSFGLFGMKIVAVELDAADAPAKVASFYVPAIHRYGPVLDCSAGKPRPPVAPKDSMRLDCSDDHPKPGEFVFKAGSKKDFHLVNVRPEGAGSRIALVYIQLRGID